MSNKYIRGLGLTASGKRRIENGAQYERLFPAPQKKDPMLTNDGSVYTTVDYCAKIVKSTLNETKQLAPLLMRNTLNETCKAIFNFFFTNYQYEIDSPTVEQLRTPARAWHDRKQGIDCDCFSVSVSSVLTNLGIPHYFRIVKMYGRDYFQHIYVVVPNKSNSNLNKRSDYYVIDPVLTRYDEEAPGITEKHDTKMGMPIQMLNGVQGLRLGREYDTLGDGLGNADVDALLGDFNCRTKAHLINTRNEIARNPGKVSRYYNVNGLLGAYNELIGAWDNENTRANVLEKLSAQEETYLRAPIQGLGDLFHGHDDELFGLIDAELSGLGSLDGKKKAIRNIVAKVTRKPETAKQAPVKAGTKGKFTKLKNVNKKIKTVAKKAGGNAKKVVKKAGKQIIKNNPVTLSARAGFLAAMKTNFGRLASRAVWAIRPESQAVAAGVKPGYIQKSKALYDRMRKTFVDTLKGNESALRKAIMTGRAVKASNKMAKKGKLSGLDQLLGYDGVGAVAEASVTAALAFLTPLITFANTAFKAKSGKEETETGGEVTPPSDPNSGEVEPTMVTNKDTTIEQSLVKEMAAPPSNENGDVTPETIQNFKTPSGAAPQPGSGSDNTQNEEEKKRQEDIKTSALFIDTDGTRYKNGVKQTAPTEGDPGNEQEVVADKPKAPVKSSNKGLITGVSLLTAGIVVAVAVSGKKDKPKALNGLEGSHGKKAKSITLK